MPTKHTERQVIEYLVRVFNHDARLSEQDIDNILNKMDRNQYVNLAGHAKNIIEIIENSVTEAMDQ
jgi:hypothetical protein